MPDMTFVNPYAFAPFPTEVRKRRAWGHVGPPRVGDGEWFAGGSEEPLYSGSIDLEWELKTPLQIPPDSPDEWLNGNTVTIPGSSIKGMTRSLHEAMFNGCARIFDADFLPGYRMPATLFPKDEENQWCLAQVVGAADGRPTRLRLTEKLTYVRARELANRIPQPTTGDVVNLDLDDAVERELPENRSRWELTPGLTATRVARRADAVRLIEKDTPADGCVFIVTDTGVRGNHPASWATGRLVDEYHELTDADAPAWEHFTRSVEGSRDLQVVRQGHTHVHWQSAAQLQSVRQFGTNLGDRVLQTGRLFIGDVIWVRILDTESGARIEEILLSQIWRRTGKVTAGERAPGILPCRPDAHGNGLCLSCATFGSVDDARKSTSDGEAVGYRGHVHFSSATATGVTTSVVTRAPLSAPKAGAGTFYLRGLDPTLERQDGDIAAHWGSGADRRAPLAGRKFFWHGDPDRQSDHWAQHGAPDSKPRYQAAAGQPLPVTGVRLVSPLTVFKGTVTFDRIPMPALQALLAALVPQRLANAFEKERGRVLAVHLGGGKPLGLGSAIPSVTALRVTSVTDRYTGGPERSAAALDLLTIKRLIAEVGRPPISELLALLDLNGLSEDEQNRVSYPPGAAWAQFGTKEFAQSFEFFGENNGQQLANSQRLFTTLPRPTATDRRISWAGKPPKKKGNHK